MGFQNDGWERQMFADFYHLSEKFWKTDPSDKYWSTLIDDMEKFAAKYREVSLGFSQRLALELANYLERKYYDALKLKGENNNAAV